MRRHKMMALLLLFSSCFSRFTVRTAVILGEVKVTSPRDIENIYNTVYQINLKSFLTYRPKSNTKNPGHVRVPNIKYPYRINRMKN
jgi:hypothetical protein